jgi:hypothetical protein
MLQRFLFEERRRCKVGVLSQSQPVEAQDEAEGGGKQKLTGGIHTRCTVESNGQRPICPSDLPSRHHPQAIPPSPFPLTIQLTHQSM